MEQRLVVGGEEKVPVFAVPHTPFTAAVVPVVKVVSIPVFSYAPFPAMSVIHHGFA